MTSSEMPSTALPLSTSSGSQFPPVKAHRVFLFYPFRFEPAGLRTRDYSWFHEHLAAALLCDLCRWTQMPTWIREAADTMDGALWQECERKVSQDLHPHVRRLAGHGSEEEPQITRSRHFQLTANGVNVLTGRNGSTGKGLQVPLTKSSGVRLGVQPTAGAPHSGLHATVLIEGASVQTWNTGIGVVILEVSYRALEVEDTANLILELNHALCRVDHDPRSGSPRISNRHPTSWRHYDSRVNEEQPGPALDAIVMALLDPAAALTDGEGPAARRSAHPTIHPDWRRDSRVTAYSYVLFADAPTEAVRRHYAVRLCRRYTLDYAVNPSEGSEAIYAPFSNILHAASIEGGCVLVHDLEGVQHVHDFLSTAVNPAYLPLAVVAFHEYRHLMQMAQNAVVYSFEGRTSERQTRRLSHLIEDLARFKLYFRFSQASQVSHHNEVHVLWRKAYRLGALLEESTGDVAQAHAVMTERRWRIYGTLATFGAVYLTLTHAVEIFFDIVLGHADDRTIAQINAYQYGDAMQKLDVLQRTMLFELRLGHISALIAAALVAWLVFSRAPHKH